jgi:hypothetical protein
MAAATPTIVRELRRVLDEASIPDVVSGPYLADETEARGLVRRADAVALPATAEDARAVVAWCYAHDVAVIPRGGGTRFAGGCVPLDGGVVLSLERVRSLRSFDLGAAFNRSLSTVRGSRSICIAVTNHGPRGGTSPCQGASPASSGRAATNPGWSAPRSGSTAVPRLRAVGRP